MPSPGPAKFAVSAFPSCASAGWNSFTWSSTVWSKIGVFAFSPSPPLRVSPSSFFLHSAIQQKNLGLSRCGPNSPPPSVIAPAFFRKTAVKTVFSGFFWPGKLMDVFAKLGVQVLAENRDSIPYTQGQAKQIIWKTFRIASAQGIPCYCAFGAEHGIVQTKATLWRPGSVGNGLRAVPEHGERHGVASVASCSGAVPARQFLFY